MASNFPTAYVRVASQTYVLQHIINVYVMLYITEFRYYLYLAPVVCGTVNTLQFPGAALGGATPPQQRAESGWSNVFILLFKIFCEMQNFCATQIFCLNLDYKD